MTAVNRDEMREQVKAAMAARQKKRNDYITMRNGRKNDEKAPPKKARPGSEGKVYA